MILNSAVCQIILGGTLGLGLGPIPQFGMRGVAAGSLTAYTISISVMGWYLFSGRARVTPKIRGLRLQSAMFFDILKVGAVSCFSPLQSVLTISIFTHMLAGFGTAVLAGYGIGARLEFLLTSLSFSFGIASVPMIGMTIGGGKVARARRIAWTAGLMSFISVGAIASIIAVFPDLWVNIFTQDESVQAASRQYLSTAAPCYAFIGLASSMYFSSQGAAKMIGPVLAQSARLVVHRARRLVAVDAWRDRARFLRARGLVDGGARRPVLRERHPDALGADARARSPRVRRRQSVIASLAKPSSVPAVTPMAAAKTAAAEIGHAHHRADHAHDVGHRRRRTCP